MSVSCVLDDSCLDTYEYSEFCQYGLLLLQRCCYRRTSGCFQRLNPGSPRFTTVTSRRDSTADLSGSFRYPLEGCAMVRMVGSSTRVHGIRQCCLARRPPLAQAACKLGLEVHNELVTRPALADSILETSSSICAFPQLQASPCVFRSITLASDNTRNVGEESRVGSPMVILFRYQLSR